jgi:hypothetical protein
MHHQPELGNHKERRAENSKCFPSSFLFGLMELKFYLNPIGENLAIASVCNQFFGKLGDTGVQVVHNHMHNSGGRLGPARILGDGISSVDQQPNLFQTSKG